MSVSFDTRTNERLIWGWARLLSAHELESLLQLFTDDVIYEDVALGVTHRGKDAVRTFAAHFLLVFPDVTQELTLAFATPTHGAAEWVMRGTQAGDLPEIPATGKRMEVRGASVLEFANGQIRRVADYWDKGTMRKQLE